MKKTPQEVVLEKDKTYYWCACGLSKDGLYCDGTHKGTGMKSVSFSETEEKAVYLCKCKKTNTPPYCDGSHQA